LFEQITRLDAYYPARTEAWILQRCVRQIAELAGTNATVVELGRDHKAPILLNALDSPAACFTVDDRVWALEEAEANLRRRFPGLRIETLAADYMQLDELPAAAAKAGRRVVFFPGSAIGDFTPDQAEELLVRIGEWAGEDALLIVGADATHDPALLLPAYDDRQGIVAAFNKNLLTRIDRELGADFSESAFRHEARFDAREQRVEMHLVSQYTQSVTVLGQRIRFAMGESIHTQNSYQYTLPKFRTLASRAGWSQRQLWMDGLSRFAVHVLDRSPGSGLH
jgi:dimethylhistidine N-methyltransferase